MSKAVLDADEVLRHATPLVHQQAHETQPYGHIIRMPIALAESVCAESVTNLNQLLADTITLRDLYKKHHWQVAGPTFYQLHLLFDKHYEEQSKMVDDDRRADSAAGRRQPRDGRRCRRGDADSAAARRAVSRSRSRSRGSSTLTKSC